MITPQFEVRQDDDFVYIDIRAPHIKASLIQFEVSEDVFVFTLPPYYLRLRFPAFVIEDDRMSSTYDLKNSKIHCRVAKLHKGEHFDDLDMLSKLLATKNQHQSMSSAGKPTIEEVDSEPQSRDESVDIAHPDFDWEIEQQIPAELSNTVKYGFNDQYSERIELSMHTGNDINELADPEHETAESKLRLLRETTKDQFDPEHYLADKFDAETIDELLHFEFPSQIDLTDEYKDRVMRLPKREFLVSNLKPIYIGIIPLVFAWAYDFRTNWGESTVESSWTIGKLAPSLCFLYNQYTTVLDAVKDTTARALTKPLYRNWNLTMQVWKDTLLTLRGSKSNILSAFARLLEVFEHDLHSVYRQILIEDYAVWIQYSSADVIESLANELEKVITKYTVIDTYLPLQEVEAAAEAGHLADSDDASDFEEE